MTLQREFAEPIGQEDTSGRFALNIVLKETVEDGEKYFIAECLEIPGCISQGDTEEEARRNIGDAVKLCLSVMFEDHLRHVIAQYPTPDLRGITSQTRLNVATVPQLEYAS
jgi:predicted RNase H-like HicB family nuclease